MDITTITAIKDIVLALAAATTATVAVIGLNRWRSELSGKANFEVARSLARATYKLRDEIASCRSPFISGSEFPASYSALKNPTAKEAAEAYAHLYQERWAPVRAALQEFAAQSLEAESLWGASIRSKTDALDSCVRELYVAIEAVIEDKAVGGQNFSADKTFGKNMRATVSASSSDDKNPLSKSITSAVAGIEKQLRPHLARS